MQEKILIKKEKLNLFEKIGIFLKRIFNKKGQNKTEANIEKKYDKNTVTLDMLRKEQDILNIQTKYENGDIKENDLSSYEKEELIKLYEEQINTLEENICAYRNKLSNYKEKIIKARNNKRS